MRPFSAIEALIAWFRQVSFNTGSIPGKAKSTRLAFLLGSSRFEHKDANKNVLKKRLLT